MPENKEELLSILHEFDNHVCEMIRIIDSYDKNDLTEKEQFAIYNCYRQFLDSLKRSYEGIDKIA